MVGNLGHVNGGHAAVAACPRGGGTPFCAMEVPCAPALGHHSGGYLNAEDADTNAAFLGSALLRL